MAGDFNKLVVTDAYASVLQSIKDLIADLAKGLDGTGTTNIPTNAIRWGSANSRFERYDGSVWVALASTMSQDVTSLSGKIVGALAGNIPVNNGVVNVSLNADLLDGFHAANLQFNQSGRDFVNGTFIQTNIDYSQAEGDPWFMEITGNSYSSAIPFDIKVQGYIYSSAIINYGGVSNGTNISGLVACNYGGKLCFWFPRQGYWQGFNVYVNSSYAGAQNNRVTSISDVAKPAVTKEVALSESIRQSYHTGNFTPNATAQNNIGAPANYGGINIIGAANGWAGFQFNSTSRYFMSSSGQTGEYDSSSGVWQWRWDNGTLSYGTVPWARLSGVPALNYLPLSGGTLSGGLTVSSLTISSNANTITMVDTDWGNKYIHANSGRIGFLNNAGNWEMYTNNSGQVWTSNYGWLHDRFANANTNLGQAERRDTGYRAGDGRGPWVWARQGYEIFNAGGGTLQLREYGGYTNNCNCNSNCNCGA